MTGENSKNSGGETGKEFGQKEFGQEEIAQILQTIKEDNTEKTKTRKIKIYDFKRPDKFSKNQIITIAMIHTTFARLITAMLSTKLRMDVHVKVDSVDQLTYVEFMRSIPNPSVLGIIEMSPLKIDSVLQFDPGISFSIVDRIFGGKGKKGKKQSKISEMEEVSMKQIIEYMLIPLRESWSSIIDLHPSVNSIETNPFHAMIVPPSDMIILVSFELQTGGIKEHINLCIPYLTIEPVIAKLSTQYYYSMTKKQSTLAEKNLIGKMKVDAAVYYKAEKLSLKELSSLKKNSMVHIPELTSGKAYLRAGGESVFNLKKREKGNSSDFIIDEADNSPEAAPDFIYPEKQKTGTIEDTIKESFGRLTEYFNNGMQNINKRISDLESDQNELSDQVYFEAADREGGSIPQIGYQNKPFGFITPGDSEALAVILSSDHPQITALILSYLDSGTAADVLSRLPENLQIETAERIAILEETIPEILEMAEKIIEKRLNKMKTTNYKVGGIMAITNILNISNSSIEKIVIEGMEKSNPEIAEDIKKNMFVFEDIILLDDDAVKEIIKASSREDLLISVKTVTEEAKAVIFRNMTKGDLEQFKKDLQKTGRRRLSEVDTAQQRIISVIRELEEGGAIIVARPEMVVD